MQYAMNSSGLTHCQPTMININKASQCRRIENYIPATLHLRKTSCLSEDSPEIHPMKNQEILIAESLFTSVDLTCVMTFYCF